MNTQTLLRFITNESNLKTGSKVALSVVLLSIAFMIILMFTGHSNNPEWLSWLSAAPLVIMFFAFNFTAGPILGMLKEQPKHRNSAPIMNFIGGFANTLTGLYLCFWSSIINARPEDGLPVTAFRLIIGFTVGFVYGKLTKLGLKKFFKL